MIMKFDPTLCVTEIRTNRQNEGGTGFFYKKYDELYLITNRHVIVDEKENYKPNEIYLRVYRNHPIRLYDEKGNPIWFIHPKFEFDENKEPIPDVVAIPLKTTENWKNIRYFSSNELPPKKDFENLYIPSSESLDVVGYDYYTPGVKFHSVWLNTKYGESYQNKPQFLVKGKLYPGCSGSPVLSLSTHLKYSTNFLKPPVLLGIYGGPLRILSSVYIEESDLNIVWYSWLIEEILTSKKRE